MFNKVKSSVVFDVHHRITRFQAFLNLNLNLVYTVKPSEAYPSRLH